MSLMTAEQFAARAVGLPWVRWRSDWRACDCYGLVILYFKEVMGVDLGGVPHTDVANGFADSSCWQECGPEAGATMWMAWRDGAPHHVGMLISDQRVLHAEGSCEAGGSVRVTRLDVMERAYGTSRFYRYTPC